MNISSVIKAPFAVQAYRVFFAAYAYYFGSFVWRERHIGLFEGLLILGTFAGFNLLGLFYTCFRAPRSRWVLASLGILIPTIVYAYMFWSSLHDMIFYMPETWWGRVLSWLPPFVMILALPITFALALFRDPKTVWYFYKSTASDAAPEQVSS